MVKKIDFTKICADNISTFRNHSDGTWSWVDFSLFLIFPIVLAASILFSEFQLKENFVTAIITAASIFAGLLLNLLVLIYTIYVTSKEKLQNRVSTANFDIWQLLIKQTFANVSFCILVSIIVVALCLLYYLNFISPVQYLIAFSLYFFCATLILHLFMVLKRIHALVEFDIR